MTCQYCERFFAQKPRCFVNSHGVIGQATHICIYTYENKNIFYVDVRPVYGIMCHVSYATIYARKPQGFRWLRTVSSVEQRRIMDAYLRENQKER